MGDASSSPSQQPSPHALGDEIPPTEVCNIMLCRTSIPKIWFRTGDTYTAYIRTGGSRLIFKGKDTTFPLTFWPPSMCTGTVKFLRLAVTKTAFGTGVNQGHRSLFTASSTWGLWSPLGSAGGHLGLSLIQSGKRHRKEHPWVPCDLLMEPLQSLAVGASRAW